MTDQRELPLGEREIARETIARVDAAMPAPAQARAGACPATPTCEERGWKCQHEKSVEERIDAIFARREPGQEG